MKPKKKQKKLRITEADVFRIDTVKKYADDYMVCIEEAKQELREKARPELTDSVKDFEQYDTIILGYPNWWGTMPMACYTFLESYDFTGKKIVPFCSHEGSGFGSGLRDLKAAVKGATVTKGLSIQGSKVNSAGKQIENFVAGSK